MIILDDPDDRVPDFKYELCAFHKQNPWKDFAGCTCVQQYGFRKATPEEKKRNKANRLHRRMTELEEELETVKYELSSL